MDPSKSIGTYLRRYRMKNKLSQQQLADILGIGLNHYGNVERGKYKPSINLLVRISNELNVSTDVLLKADLEYVSKQAANEYVGKIQALPREKRERLYNVIDIFLSLTENK